MRQRLRQYLRRELKVEGLRGIRPEERLKRFAQADIAFAGRSAKQAGQKGRQPSDRCNPSNEGWSGPLSRPVPRLRAACTHARLR
jgi:hypothetical protein